jgi:hypothetical protein
MVCKGTQKSMSRLKGQVMNRWTPTKEQQRTVTHGGTDASEKDGLALCGFTAEESITPLWLEHWYQSGGSDRMERVRVLEFLEWLVMAGLLEV